MGEFKYCISFYTLNLVNYCKITRFFTFPVNTQMCCSHKQWYSVFLLVRYYSHISTKILVHSGVSI